MNRSNRALLDTNILVYADQKQHEYHQASKTLRDQGLRGEISVCISPQVLSEFFATVTNRKQVTDPLSSEEAMDEIKKYDRARRIRKIYPGKEVFKHVRALFVQRSTIKGQHFFDLLLAATMLENGINRIYTYNTADFAPYTEIEVLTPPIPTDVSPQ